jgi:hypothetical protein
MRFQANPDGTILAQNDIELLYEARESLTVCWIILRSEIKVNSVHRIFRANAFAIVHKFVEKTILVAESGGGGGPDTLDAPPPTPAPAFVVLTHLIST